MCDHRADSVWIFGSVARGNVVASSDGDLVAAMLVSEGSRMAEAIDLLIFHPGE